MNSRRGAPTSCPRSKRVDFLLERGALGFELVEPGIALGDRVVHGFAVAGFTDTFLERVDLVPELALYPTRRSGN